MAMIGRRISEALSDTFANSGSFSDEKHLQKQIRAGQVTLRRFRIVLSGVMMVSGLMFGIAYEVAFRFLLKEYQSFVCGLRLEDHLLAVMLSILLAGRLLFVSLAPLADDIVMTRLVLLFDFLVTFFALDQELDKMWIHRHVWDQHMYMWAVYSASKVAFLALVMRAFFCRTVATMQKCMWEAVSIWLMTYIPIIFGFGIQRSIRCGRICTDFYRIPTLLFVFYVAKNPRVALRVQVWIRKAIKVKSSEIAAAGIAGLVGGCSAKQAMVEGQARFRSVYLADITSSDMATNDPDPSLLQHVLRGGMFKHCDAFVSHSWHDDAPAKWSALQGWRSRFIEKMGREPTIWIDKCCMDQTNIEADLRCLPIFLCGCRSMVVLCGTSYLSRLWCIIEIFTYMHIRRSNQTLEFVPVLRDDLAEKDRESIDLAFMSFDADTCDCVDPVDKAKLLGIIKAAFGDVCGFNRAVKLIFSAVGFIGEEIGQTTVGCMVSAARALDILDSDMESASSASSLSDSSSECEAAAGVG